MELLKKIGSIIWGILVFLAFVAYFVWNAHAVNQAANQLDCGQNQSVEVNYFGPLNGPPAECVDN